jgi:hypothetical protein
MFLRRNKTFLLLTPLLIFVGAIELFAQSDFVELYTFRPNTNCSITIKVKKSKVKCEDATDTKRLNNKIQINNSVPLESEINSGRMNKYLSWKFEVTSCDGKRKIITRSIDLTNYALDGDNDLADFSFEAKEFKIIETSVKNQPNYDKDIDVVDPNKAPTFINGPREAYAGDDLTLVAEGGSIVTAGSKYVWTEGSPTGKIIFGAETSTLNIKASNVAKKYFVYIVDKGGNKTASVSAEVKILTISRKADRINGPEVVCNNATKKITLEVVGGGLGDMPNGGKAEWVWHINSETGPIIDRGQRITIDQPMTQTTYFVAPEGGATQVASVSHTIDVVAPSDITNASLIASNSKICQQESVNLELRGANLNSLAKVNWYETNTDHFKKPISNSLKFSFSPTKTSTYGVFISDKCITTPELKTTITVVENSILPDQIVIDSSSKGRMVKLSLANSNAKLNNDSKWIWFLNDSFTEYDSQHKPVKVPILNIGSDSILIKADRILPIALKAYGECETNDQVTVTVPRKLDKYFFMTIGASSNDMGDLATKVITIGTHRLYFRTRQSLNSTSIGNYGANSFVTDGKSITNFPVNSGNYYTFNGESVNVRSSYTAGFFLNQNDVKLYLGGGVGTQTYYNGVDVSSYQSSSSPVKSWAQNVNFNNGGAELEVGVSVKLKNFYLMTGASYLMGSAPSKGYISVDLNVGFAF